MGKPIGVGSKLMLPPLMPCGFCDWCKHYPEQANKCLTPVYYGRYLGFDKPPHLWGGWAEYVYVDLGELPGTKIYKLPDDMALLLGSLSEPLTSCIRAFNRAIKAGGFKWSDTVVIQGTGPIGILAIAAAQEMGAGPRHRRRRAGEPAPQAGARVRRRGDRRHRDSTRQPRRASRPCATSSAAGAPTSSWTARATRAPAPRASSSCATAAPTWRWASSRMPARSRPPGTASCTKDINVLGSWAFTANDLAARRRHALQGPRQVSLAQDADAVSVHGRRASRMPWRRPWR